MTRLYEFTDRNEAVKYEEFCFNHGIDVFMYVRLTDDMKTVHVVEHI